METKNVKTSCLQCGAAMRTAPENVKYDACGLPNVTLVGVEVSRCPSCGEYEIAIPRIEELHQVIATAIIEKPQRLTPPEIRYLRKYLGLSGVDFAARMGVDPATVSRWERESSKQRMSVLAERLLRLMVAHERPAAEYPAAKLARVAMGKPAGVRLRVKGDRGAWHAEAA